MFIVIGDYFSLYRLKSLLIWLDLDKKLVQFNIIAL